jgi:hypothetical protein
MFVSSFALLISLFCLTVYQGDEILKRVAQRYAPYWLRGDAVALLNQAPERQADGQPAVA